MLATAKDMNSIKGSPTFLDPFDEKGYFHSYMSQWLPFKDSLKKKDAAYFLTKLDKKDGLLRHTLNYACVIYCPHLFPSNKKNMIGLP